MWTSPGAQRAPGAHSGAALLHALILVAIALLSPGAAAQVSPAPPEGHAVTLLPENAAGRVRFVVRSDGPRIVRAELLSSAMAATAPESPRGKRASYAGRTRAFTGGARWTARRAQQSSRASIWEAAVPSGLRDRRVDATLLVEVEDETGATYVYPLSQASAIRADAADVTVGAVTIAPESVDNATAQTVRAEVQLTSTEDLSFVMFALRHSSGEEVSNIASHISGSSSNGTWQADIEVPAFSPTGTWELVVSYFTSTAFGEASTGRSVTVSGVSDTLPPQQNGTATVAPASVDVSAGPQTVDVSVPLSDDVSGVESVSFYFRKGDDFLDGGSPMLASGTDMNGTWSATAEIPESAPSGTFTLFASVSDRAGNFAEVNTGITLQVGGGDSDGPALSGTSAVTPASVSVESGPQTVTAEATLEDASGVDYVVFSLHNGTESLYGDVAELISGDAASGRWRGAIEVPQNAEAGSWTVRVEAADALGNYSDLSTGLSVTVGGGDAQDPTLAGTPTITPAAVTLTDQPQTVTVDIPVQDNATGVSAVDFYFTRGFQSISAPQAALVSGTAMNGVWRGEAQIPVSTEQGDWQLVVFASDEAGNSGTINTGVFLTVQGGDTEAPVVGGSATVLPSTVDLTSGAQVVTARVPLTDAQSGVHEVTLVLRAGSQHIASAQAVLVSGDSTTGVWGADLTVPQGTADGVLNLYATATDGAENTATRFTDAAVTVSGGDVTGPALNGTVSVDPSSVVVSDDPAGVTVTVPLQDAGSAVASVRILLAPSAGGFPITFASAALSSGTAASGTWEAVVTVPQRTAEGIYNVVVEATDGAGNKSSIESGTVTVTGGDVTGPTLAGVISLAPTSVSVGGGPADVTATAPLADAGTGIISVTLELLPALGGDRAATGFATLASGTAQDGTWQAVISVPRNTPEGAYVVRVTAVDSLGNSSAFTSEATVQVSGSDVVAPEYGGTATLNPTAVDLTNGEQTVTATVLLRDPGSGVLEAAFGLRSPDGETRTFPVDAALASGTAQEGTWQATITVPAHLNPGQYELFAVAMDAASNTSDDLLTGAELQVTIDAPGLVGNPSPADDEVDIPESAALSWSAATAAVSYDIYIWPADRARPAPYATGIFGTRYSVSSSSPLAYGTTYNWQVVARNAVAQTEGPVWSFTTRRLADLEVTRIDLPPDVLARQFVDLEWVVTNGGAVGTTAARWTDEVYLSSDTIIIPRLDHFLGRFSNPAHLPAGESYVQRQRLQIPDRVFGELYILIRTNTGGDGSLQQESNFANNLGQKRVHVTLPPPPDLVTTSLLIPEQVFSGREIPVRWTVENTGTGSTYRGAWDDSLYISPDSILATERAVVRARYRHVLDIAPDSSYTAAMQVELPADLSGTYYVHLKLDAVDYVYEPGGEDNNYARRPLEVTLTPPPDLVVSDVQALGGLSSGQRARISWTVTNEGLDTARVSWSDRVFLSPSETFNEATAKVLGTFSSPGLLPRDSSYTQRREVTLPDGAEGAQYIFVMADLGDRLFEGTFEDNNMGRSDAVSVALSPWADLRAASVAASGGERAGDEVSIIYEVVNDGDVPAGASWVDSLFVSASPTWDRSGARAIAVARRVEPLAVSGTYIQSVLTRLPTDLSGALYLYVLADAAKDVYEHSDEANNVLRSEALQVGAYPPVDLTVMPLEVPAEATSGSTIAVTYTVRNAGEAPTLVTAWRDRVYLSLDAAYSPATDSRLLEVQRSQRLAGVESYARTVDVRLPDGISGTYHLIVVTDADDAVAEVDDQNNAAVSGAIAVGLGGVVDLQVSASNVPATLVAGQPASITWTVRNAGAAQTRDTLWVDEVYLSQSAELSSSSRQLAASSRRGALGAGGEYTVTSAVTVPTYASGKYYLLLVADRREHVYEHQGEANNVLVVPVTVAQPPPSDLVVASVIVPDAATVGNDVLVSWTLRNQGVNPASGLMTSGVYFSSDQAWDVDDPLLALDTRQIDVPAGSSTEFAAKVSLATVLAADSTGTVVGKMPGVLPGAYFALVRADLLNNIPESEEQNNTGVSANTVDVSVPVLTVDVPVTRRWNHANSHYFAVDVEADLDLRLRLTRSSTFAGGVYVAYERMPSASSYDHYVKSLDGAQKEVLVPSTRAGRYYVMVASDHLFFDEEEYTLLAEALGFSVTSISPGRIGQGVVTTRLQGAGFRESTRVTLRTPAGATVAEGAVVRRPNTTELAVRWDLAQVPLGTYTVVAENEGGAQASLAAAVEVEPVRTPALEMVRTTPSALLTMRNTTYVFQFRNTANVDIPYATITMSMRGSTAVTVETDGRLLTRTMMEKNVGAELARPAKDFADVGGVRVVPLVARNVEPGEALEARLSVVPAAGFERFPVTVRWQLQDRTVFAQEQLERIERARQAVLANANGVAPEFMEIAQDPQAFAEFVMQGLVQLGLLEEGEVPSALSLQGDVLRKMALITDPLAPQGIMTSGVVCSNLSAADEVNFGPLCEMIFTVTGCVAAVADCFVDIPFIPLSAGASAALCVFGVSTACTGTDVGLAGCIGVFSAINCIAKELICDKLVFSLDPNDIIGPEGYGDRRWVGVNQTLPYTIRFENDPELATAPAQVVRVTLPVDSTLDERSFRLGSFGFRGWRFDVPADASSYSARLDLRDSIGIYVDVEAGIDVETRRAFWTLRSIDPATGAQPNDPFSGFLAVNDSLGAGEGYVSYSVRPKSASRTGDLARAEARIVFDLNEAISTPPIANTIDAGRPTSRVSSTWEEVAAGQVRVSWSGGDDENGSGLRDYALYVSEDNRPFQLHQSGLTGTSTVVAADPSHTYRFFVLATDNAGNVEASKAEGELVVGTASESEDAAPAEFALHGNFPNPFRQTTTVRYDVAQSGDVEFHVYDLLGRRVLQFKLGTVQAGTYRQQLDMSTFASGVYLFDMRVKAGGALIFREARKMVLVK